MQMNLMNSDNLYCYISVFSLLIETVKLPFSYRFAVFPELFKNKAAGKSQT